MTDRVAISGSVQNSKTYNSELNNGYKKEKSKNVLKTKYFDVIIAHAIFFHVMILFTLLRISKGSTVIKSCCENCDSATTTPTGSASSQDICSICAHRLRVVFIAARCRLKKKNKTDGSLSKSDIRTKHFDQLHSWFFIFFNFQLSTEDIQDNRHSMYDLVYCWAP